MGRKKDWGTGELRSHIALQAQIYEKFGDEAIEKAKQRLCSKCQYLFCSLLPICTDGSDCPYFKLKEIKE